MNEKQEIIDKIHHIASESATIAIEQYSNWHFVSAITWLTLGCILVIVGILFLLKPINSIISLTGGLTYGAVLAFMIILGMLIACNNIVNIFHPEAYAIHQLLMDLRG